MTGLAKKQPKRNSTRPGTTLQQKTAPRVSARKPQDSKNGGGKAKGTVNDTSRRSTKPGKIQPAHRNTDKTIKRQPAVDESFFLSVAAAVQDAVFVVDREDRILYANAAAERVFELPSGGLTGKDRGKLFPPEIAARQKQALDSVFETGDIFASEVKFPYPLGEKWTSTTLSPIRDPDGRITAVLGVARDIENVKRAEKALQSSETRHRSVVENSLQGISIFQDGRLVFVNQAICEMLGFAAHELTALSQAEILAMVHPDDRAASVARETARSQGKAAPNPFEYRVLRRDGTIRCLETFLTHIDYEGQPGLLCSTIDITERQLAEQAVQASEKRFRALIEKNADGIAMLNADGMIIYASPSSTAIFGRPPEDLVGQNMLSWLHPDSFDQVGSLFVDLLQEAGKSVTAVIRILHPGKDEHWIEVTGTNLLNEPSIGAVVANYRDVSERIQAGEMVRESEERFRSTFEQAAVGVAHASLDGRYLRVNDKLCEFTGYTRDELLNMGFLDITHPEDKQVQEPHLEQLIKGGLLTFTIEKRYIRKNGDVRWVQVTVSLVRSENGSPEYLMAITQDIDERKTIEAELKKSQVRFRSLVSNLPGMAYRCRNDIDWTMEFISEGCRDLTGYAPEDFISGNRINYEEIMDPGDRQRVRDEINAAVAKNQPYELAYRIIRADGEDRWVWDRGRTVGPDEAGHEMLEGFVTDITDLVKRQRALETLHAGGLTLSSSLNPYEIGQGIIRVLEDRLDWHHAAVRMRREGTDELELLAFSEPHDQSPHHDKKEESARSRIARLGEGVSGWVIAHGETVRSGDLSKDPRYVAIFQNMASGLYVPIKAADRTFGCISVEDVHPNAFTAEDERLLTTLASQAAVALENARLFAQAEQRAVQFMTVSRLSKSLAEMQDIDRIFELLAHSALDLIPDTAGTFISLFDEKTHLITAAYGMVDNEVIDVAGLPAIPLAPADQGTQSRVIHTREPLIIGDLQETLKQSQAPVVKVGSTKPDTQSAMYVPMIGEGRVIGILQLQSYTPNRFTETDVRLISLIANTAAVAIQNARLFDQLQQRLEQLSALHSIDMVISASTDLRVNLKVILETAQRQLKADAVSVLMLNPVTLTLEYSAGTGFDTPEITRSLIRLGDGSVGRIPLSKETLILPNLSIASRDFTRQKLIEAERLVSYVGVPLVAKGQVKGILEVYHRTSFDTNGDWLSFLNLLSGQTAIAMDNSLLFENLERANAELTLAYDATIEGWSQALEMRGSEAQGHSRRVLDWTLKLAHEMGMRERDMQRLRHGTLLHDIGKMGIPDEILRKPGALTGEEWEIMRRHPQYAYDLLAPITYLRPALEIPYSHHEKWDGTGYPRGLKGEEIPFAARIFSVVDVYDALTSDRPYRPAWTHEQAVEYIQDQTGKHFDPGVAETFLQIIRMEKHA
jgi:PAS domain S-box-containing protein